MTSRSARVTTSKPARRSRRLGRFLAATAVAVGALTPAPAYSASVTSATFSGGAGTVTVGGALYAKQGAAVTLTLNTSADTKCVDVAGAFKGIQTSATPKSSWVFTTTAGAGDGAQAVTVAASPDFNNNNRCTGASPSTQASYVLDNTGPVVTATRTPAPNAAGWNNTDIALTWAATDAGSGVGSGPTPATDSQNANTAGAVKTATAADRLGNSSTGSVTVRLDKAAPTITATPSPQPNAAGWHHTDVTVAFSCTDAGDSGVKSCSPARTLDNEGAGQSVTGTVVDNADNTSSTTVSGINIDKTAPSLSGTPTASPNPAGWYRTDVAVDWTAADSLSGLAGSTPADSVVVGEGTGLVATATVGDKAGNATTAQSTPVKIDRTAPVTAISGAPDGWANGELRLTLVPADALSGVAATTYAVDGGAQRTGTDITLTDEGEHSITFGSTDNAGNAEEPRAVVVRIDKTAPAIGHSFTPGGYTDGAWSNGSVKVTFTCSDSGSGVASCTDPVTVNSDGAGQQVTGTAKDAAGNTATDTATVNIDTVPPTIRGSADRAPNAAGWYHDDVTVVFAAADALSGLASATASALVGEGAGQSVTGTATDLAANTATDTVSDLNVDKTAPVLSAGDVSGWHRGDVRVDWSCDDVLSGVADAPVDVTVTGEGDDLAASASCRDRAGNEAVETVSGIRIDRTAPTTTAEVPEPLTTGWYAGPVAVTLTGHDALSGVEAVRYRVDDGPVQVYDGRFTVAAKGSHTVRYWSVDVAGNVEDSAVNSLVLQIDGVAPTTTVVNPVSPASGWFVTSGIPVAFEAADAESGVATTYYTVDGGEPLVYGEPFTADLSTGRHVLEFWSVDVAGNVEARQSTVVAVDTVAPAISGRQTPTANEFGWNNTDVDVSFACTDEESGVAGCAGDTTLVNEGADQAVRGDVLDVAGNTASIEFGPVHIDKTAPTLTGVPTTLPNAAGWYSEDVAIDWVGHDGLSGIDPASQPSTSTVTGEGRDLGAGPVRIADKAGNRSAAASVSGINIDRTAPEISGAPTTRPNDAGWYRTAVTVDFACTDGLSGVASCPTSVLLTEDGADQEVTSDPASDRAGNTRPGATVSGVNIDGTAPVTAADNQCTRTNGWCTGETANVVLTAVDQGGLSGVKEIHYLLDGGTEQVAAGARETVSVPLDGSGAGSVTYWAVDRAGNAERANSVSLRWDNIAPTVTHTLTPAANANDWNNADVTVHFDAADDDAGSGVDASTVTEDVAVTEETAGLLVAGSAADVAGNLGTDRVLVKLDKTAPTITGEVTGGTPGGDGWYVGPVTVTFGCADALSGVAICPEPVRLTSNGTNSAVGTVTDRAGNTATTTVDGIRIDTEKPALTNADVNVAGQTYLLGNAPTATCTASDAVSGVASCRVTVSGGKANGVGTFTWTATATDRAGNITTLSGTYQVVYRFDGFLQPVNDTAHQVGASTSIFKAGSTVPAKLRLRRADGTVVQATTSPVWLTPVKGSSTSAPVDETAYSASADSGSTFRYDSTEQQYLYHWKTTNAGGNYWRMGVSLDDGRTYYVNIGLR